MIRDRVREGLLLVGCPGRPEAGVLGRCRQCERGSGSVRPRWSRQSSSAPAWRRSSGGRASHLGAPGDALAQVAAPRFAGQVTAVQVRSANGDAVPVELRDGRVTPRGTVGSGERLTIELTVRRPGWAAWLVGRTDHPTFTVETPSAHLLGRWLQIKSGGQVTVAFDKAVSVVSLAGKPPRRLDQPQRAVPDRPGRERHASHGRGRRRSRSAHLGTSLRTGARELVPRAPVPAAAGQAHAGHGDRSQAGVHPDVLEPGRGGAGHAGGRDSPPLCRATGAWSTRTRWPSGRAGSASGSAPRCASCSRNRSTSRARRAPSLTSTLRWQVPEGATLRLQQLLAQLGYLPLDWHPSANAVLELARRRARGRTRTAARALLLALPQDAQGAAEALAPRTRQRDHARRGDDVPAPPRPGRRRPGRTGLLAVADRTTRSSASGARSATATCSCTASCRSRSTSGTTGA